MAARWLVLGACLLPAATTAQERADDEASARRILRTHCLSCHGTEDPEGDLSLEPLLAAPIRGRSAAWEAVLGRLEDRDMPPRKAAGRPSEDEYRAASAWLRKTLLAAPVRHGRTTRRLNRAEYNNTIRDLLRIDHRPADAFPQDLGLEGFDNIAEAQSVSPLLVEKYLRAARDSLALATVRGPEPRRLHIRGYPLNYNQRNYPFDKNPPAVRAVVRTSIPEVEALLRKPYHQQYAPDVQFFSMDWSSAAGKDWNGSVREGKGAHGYEVLLPHDGRGTRRAEMSFKNPLPLGRYRLRARATAEPPRGPRTGPCVMAFYLNNRRVGETSVEPGAQPGVYEIEFTTDRLQNKIVMVAAAAAGKKDLPGIPALVLCDAELEGPLYDAWPPASHRAVFGDGASPPREVLRRFVSRAFRRPARPDEVAHYVAIAEAETRAGAGPEAALLTALEAVLVSPSFLFRVETDPPNDWALASRLSYFLWSSMPDEALLGKAEEGRLRDPGALADEVGRMLSDPKAEALVENFASLWIGTRRIHDLAPDPTVFKDWDEDLRRAMREEPHHFFRHVLRENLSVLTFLDSDFTFVNERLARHYGLEGVRGDAFRKVSLRPEHHRGGLLTQAAVLTLGAQPTRSSPVFRGKFVFEKLFNRPPPNPPPDIPALPQEAARSPRNLREQLALHAREPKCAACHVKIDPWGLPLEGYDGIGAWRGGTDDDLTAVFEDGRSVVGDVGLRRELRARADEFVRGLAEKMMTYALGRTLRLEDRQALPAIVARVRDDGYRFRTLIREIVFSSPFRS